ncbi:MAG: formaldehyde-activating enzyme [Planctomyces sp.]|nr:formaldehyde-activating enzyme [Planctomyces sp.]
MAGDGNELAHIDVMIGSKSGPVGNAFARALANQEAGFNKLLVTLEPNSAVKPSTVLVPKVQLSTADETFRLFGPTQYAIARAVIESVKDGTISKSLCDDWVIVCGVFIHSGAEDHEKILSYNFEAAKLAIKRALNEEPSINQVLRQREDITAPAAD